MNFATAIEQADAELTRTINTYGINSANALDAMYELDCLIQEEAMANDGWSDAEVRAMNGESL